MKIDPTKRVLHRERVVKQFSGRTVTPSIVAGVIGVDRAAACRILQRLVALGHARYGAERGHYVVGKARKA